MPIEPEGRNITTSEPHTSKIKRWLARVVRAPRPLAHIPRRLAPHEVLAGTALVVATLAAVTVFFDEWVIIEVRRLPEPLIAAFDRLTDFGKSGWFLFPLGVFLLTVAAVSAVLPRISALVLASVAGRAGFLVAAIAAPGLFTTVLKYLVGRARPYVTGVADAYAYSPFNLRAEYASFPSGHTTTAFAAAVAIGAMWPHARVAMWIYALGIAVSRVVVTAHYPSDVIASAIVGVAGALLVRNYFAARGLGFGVWSDGSVHAFAGPLPSRVKRIVRAVFTR
jgi:membrane-associated phospholipid phosphatase